MATLQKRKSHGQTYWYIVESRRVNGKPRPVTLAYLGKAEDLFLRLTNQKSYILKSYSHGDNAALLNIANELQIVDIINRYLPVNKKTGIKQNRDELTVGASLLLAAIGHACQPTSKMGWYDWCKETSLEYCLKTSFKNLDSQHFWDQMNALPVESIPLIEKDIIKKLISTYKVDLKGIRLASIIEKKEGRKGKLKINYQLEKISPDIEKAAAILNLSDQNLRPKVNFRVYK